MGILVKLCYLRSEAIRISLDQSSLSTVLGQDALKSLLNFLLAWSSILLNISLELEVVGLVLLDLLAGSVEGDEH